MQTETEIQNSNTAAASQGTPSASKSDGSTDLVTGDVLKIADSAAEARLNASRNQRADASSGMEKIMGAMAPLVERSMRMKAADRDDFEARQKRDRAIDFWEASGVPTRYAKALRRADFSRLPEKIDGQEVRSKYRAVFDELCRVVYPDAGVMVCLSGSRGSGKTWMACSRVKSYCADVRSAIYRRAMDFFLELRSAIARGDPELDVENRYCRPQLLVLDAIEEKADSVFQAQMLTSMLDRRLANLRETILISNEDADALQEKIGPSLADRINDGGGIIVCDWPSLRGHPLTPSESGAA